MPIFNGISTAVRSTAVDVDPNFPDLTLAVPGGTAAGMLLLAHLQANTEADPLTVTPPAGWTIVQDAQTGAAPGVVTRWWYGWRLAPAGVPASYTWTWSAGVWFCSGLLAVYALVDAAAPVAVVSFINAFGLPTANQRRLVSVIGVDDIPQPTVWSRGPKWDTPAEAIQRAAVTAEPVFQQALNGNWSKFLVAGELLVAVGAGSGNWVFQDGAEANPPSVSGWAALVEGGSSGPLPTGRMGKGSRMGFLLTPRLRRRRTPEEEESGILRIG